MNNGNLGDSKLLIGQEIKKMREAHQLGIAAVAYLCGLTEKEISGIESGQGEFTIGMLQQIAEALQQYGLTLTPAIEDRPGQAVGA